MPPFLESQGRIDKKATPIIYQAASQLFPLHLRSVGSPEIVLTVADVGGSVQLPPGYQAGDILVTFTIGWSTSGSNNVQFTGAWTTIDDGHIATFHTRKATGDANDGMTTGVPNFAYPYAVIVAAFRNPLDLSYASDSAGIAWTGPSDNVVALAGKNGSGSLQHYYLMLQSGVSIKNSPADSTPTLVRSYGPQMRRVADGSFYAAGTDRMICWGIGWDYFENSGDDYSNEEIITLPENYFKYSRAYRVDFGAI